MFNVASTRSSAACEFEYRASTNFTDESDVAERLQVTTYYVQHAIFKLAQ